MHKMDKYPSATTVRCYLKDIYDGNMEDNLPNETIVICEYKEVYFDPVTIAIGTGMFCRHVQIC